MTDWRLLVIPAFIGAGSSIATKFATELISSWMKKSDVERARRKEDLDLFEKIVFELRDIAKEYWSSDENDALTAASVVGRLTFIGEFTAERSYFPDDIETLVNMLDDVCTSGDFQSTIKRAEPFRAIEIEQNVYRLVHAARRARKN